MINPVTRRPKAKAVVDDSAGSAIRVRGSGARQYYETLRQSIIDLTLEPGSPLDEVGLSGPIRTCRGRQSARRWYGLRRTGSSRTLPNRKTIVAPIDFVRLPSISRR